MQNPNNSIILYITGLSNDFDFQKRRSNMSGGSPPDIDVDYDPRGRDKVVEYLINKWGREHVAHIGTYGTFGLQSIARDNTRISEPLEPKKSDFEDEAIYEDSLKNYKENKKRLWDSYNELDKLIPAAKFGIAPSYEDMIEKSPQIKDEYPVYDRMVGYADGMRSRLGVHAAGIVLSDFPIIEAIPLWKNDTYERITQFDKDEVEKLGLIKFDELVVDALSVISECIKLIKQELDIAVDLEKDIYNNDGDEQTYKMMSEGLLTGVFQMETSPMAKDLIKKIKPENVLHLSDINALNRPGPIQSGLVNEYIENRKKNYVPENIPVVVANILSKTYGVLVYQEQVMKLCTELAGFNGRDADEVRRAMGRKKAEVIKLYEEKFIQNSSTKSRYTLEDGRVIWIKDEHMVIVNDNKKITIREAYENSIDIIDLLI